MLQHLDSVRSKRLLHILFLCSVFIIIILLRLFYLQIEQKRLFSRLGRRNFLKTEVILPVRGNLYDAYGVLLATNTPIFDVYWQGTGIS